MKIIIKKGVKNFLQQKSRKANTLRLLQFKPKREPYLIKTIFFTAVYPFPPST